MDALEQLKTSIPDLVLLDLRLPRVHGVHILREIRQDERLKRTRVIITSIDATQTQFVRDAADLILVKPVGFNQLRELAARLKPETDLAQQ
jgi:CheY-like chemotaxis protein